MMLVMDYDEVELMCFVDGMSEVLRGRKSGESEVLVVV